MRCNIRSVNSTLRTARALNDPYQSDELKLFSTDRKGLQRSVRIERTEFAFNGSLQCGCIGHECVLNNLKWPKSSVFQVKEKSQQVQLPGQANLQEICDVVGEACIN